MCQIGERRAMVGPLMILIGLRTRSLLGEIDYTTCEKLGAVSTRVNRWLAELVRGLRFRSSVLISHPSWFGGKPGSSSVLTIISLPAGSDA